MRRLHTIGDVWVKIGNDGTFASTGSGETDDQQRLIIGRDPTFEFPANSGRGHSYIGGLWIAGIRNWDTLAVVAADAASNTWYDFGPTSPVRSAIDSSRGFHQFECTYSDTAPAPHSYFPRHPKRLGLEVRQRSYAFGSPPYDRFVIIDYLIRNVSGFTIRKPFIGFFDDCDIFHDRVSGLIERGSSEDLSGYLRDYTVAYCIDNDGDPRSDSVWHSTSSMSAMGIAPVYADPAPICTTFNWWATDFMNLTWGPERVSPHYDVESMPASIADVYQTMANNEIDYDQLWSALT